MATYTPNLNLKKPAGTDHVLVSDFNANADLLDAAIGAQAADRTKQLDKIFGLEYLTFYHNKIRTNAAAKIIFSGDSTTAGGLMDATMDTDYYINKLAEKLLRNNGYHNYTIVNAGHSGATATDWVDTEGVDYLTVDLAQSPDLYVVRFGINDAGLANPLSTFEASMRDGLTRIRAAKTADELSVVLMMPNSAINPLIALDTDWYSGVYTLLFDLATEFQCAFVDTYHYLLDVENVKWTDEFVFSEETLRVHPNETANSLIMSLLAPCLIPESLRFPTKIDLLWENSDVTASYAAGTLSIPDMAQYEAILILVNNYVTLQTCGAPLLLKQGQSGAAQATTQYIAWRIFQFYDATTVSIGGGYVNTTYATPAPADAYAIPVRIYGIRNIGIL